MDEIKDNLRAHIAHTTPDFLENWDTASAVGGAIMKHSPIPSEILRSAAQTERAKRENMYYQGLYYSRYQFTCLSLMHRSPVNACQVIITQLAKLQSRQLHPSSSN